MAFECLKELVDFIPTQLFMAVGAFLHIGTYKMIAFVAGTL